MINNHKLEAQRLARALGMPFISLVIILISIVFIAIYSANNIDTYAKETSIKQLGNIIEESKVKLQFIAKEYSFWNEAINKIIIERDIKWTDTELKDNLPYSYGINKIFVLNDERKMIYSAYGEERNDIFPEQFLSNEIQKLISLAIYADLEDPVPQAGFVKLDGQIHMFAVSSFTAYESEESQLVHGKSYGTLIITQELDREIITRWSDNYDINNLTLKIISEKTDILNGTNMEMTLYSPENQVLGKLQWSVEDVGKIFFKNFVPSILILLFLLLLLSFVFYKKLKRYSEISFQNMLHNEKLSYQANFDYLTGLPNRILFDDRATQQIKNCVRENTISAILYVDLDELKKINDSLGHHSGDIYLKQAALKMKNSIRLNDTVARVGGDEFCILLNNIEDEKNINIIANKILSSLNEEFLLFETKVSIKASIGIVLFPTDGDDLTLLLEYADFAMYKSKSSGGNKYSFYAEEAA